MRAAGGAGLAANQVVEPGADRGGRGRPPAPRYPYKPPIPLTVHRQPGDRAARRRDARDQRGLPVGARPARRRRAPPRRPRALPRPATACPRETVARGLTAGTFQHEVDHLDGVLFLDRVTDPRTFTHLGAVRAPPPGRRSSRRIAPYVRRGRGVSVYWCELAWLGGAAAEAGVLIEVEVSGSSAVLAGVAAPPPGAERLAGSSSPGWPTPTRTPSSARCAGAPSGAAGSFWTWREQMYALAERLDPELTLRARPGHVRRDGARRHHARRRVPLPAPRPGGVPYADPNAMGAAVIQAAAEAGIRLTLLDACYLHGGIGTAARRGAAALLRPRRRGLGRAGRPAGRRPAGPGRGGDPQRPGRRPGGGAQWWPRGRRRAGAAARPRLRAAGRERGLPGGLRRHADRRARRAGALSERFTAVHATHVSEADMALLGEARAAAACARRPSATSPTGSGRPGGCATPARGSRSAATPTR